MTSPALATRARGLASRLLPPAALDAVDSAADHARLAAELAGRGLPVTAADAATADELDRVIAAAAVADLVILERWDPDDGALAILRDDADRRAVRAAIRSVAGRIAAGRRLADAAPTRSLPAAALTALAEATTTAEIGAVLRRQDHPYADLIPAKEAVDPLALEHALAARFHRRARRHAGRDPAIASYAGKACDGDNAAAALLLSERRGDLPPDDRFLPGGDRIRATDFAAAAAAEPARARAILADRLARTPLAAALAGDAPPSALEEAVASWQLADQTARVRRDPVGAAAVLWLALRRRDESRRLRRAIWRLALGGRA